MKCVPLEASAAFPLRPNERLSFAEPPKPCRVTGPPGLVRLVERNGVKEGAFWFEEPVFSRLREQARRDLAQQNPGKKQAFARPMREMMGMYMKHCLRSDLAISKDWTPNFDSYVVLPLRPIDSVIAWVGRIANQPYYSMPRPNEADYAARKAAFDLAQAGGVRLLASEKQYVIRFDFPANNALKNRILGPFDF